MEPFLIAIRRRNPTPGLSNESESQTAKGEQVNENKENFQVLKIIFNPNH